MRCARTTNIGGKPGTLPSETADVTSASGHRSTAESLRLDVVRAWRELYIRILLDGADPSTFLYTALSSLVSFFPRRVFGVRAAPPQASVVLVVV